MTTPTDAEPLIFPLGHYIGAYYPGTDEPLAYHTVRIGRQPIRLGSDAELTLWGLAHGGADEAATPWTRSQVIALAEDAEIPDADELLDELIADDIIVEVHPDSADAIDFAEAHRVMPLLFGLGASGSDSSLRQIGFGAQVAAEVDSFTFELWRYGRLTDNLWSFCTVYGEALRQAVGLSEEETAPERLLSRALHDIQRLLARHAAYLDVSPSLWS